MTSFGGRLGSMRVRLTVLVVLTAGALSVVAATIGVDRLEASLIDDAVDAKLDLVAETVFFLEGPFGDGPFLDEPFRDGPFGDEPVGDAPVGDELELALDDDVTYLTEGLGSTTSFLQQTGVLDQLLAEAGRTPEEGLPVLTELGLVALVGPDGQPTRLTTATAREWAETEGPMAVELDLLELMFDTLSFDPFELMAELPADDGTVDELDVADVLAGTVLEVEDDTEVIVRGRNVDGLDLLITIDGADLQHSADRVRAVLWTSMPILMVGAGLVAWLLTGRALAPVRRITGRVDEISAGTLHERVPVPATGDEIQELASTMNGMLSRLEADDRRLRQFVSDASHELRSPVAALRSMADVALRVPDQTDPSALADGVLAESLRLQQVVDDLLVLVRHQEMAVAGGGQVFDLDDVVLSEAARTRRVPVDTSGVSAGRVAGLPTDARRVVQHLLDNAARHARSGAAVTLRTDGDEVVLLVDDDGPGVPPAERERIFERFTRLEEARTRDSGGAGLGLAVVTATTTAMGGTVLVTDAPDRGGARFALRLPAAH